MKFFVSLAAAAGVSYGASAQKLAEKELPAAVRSSFQQVYPEVKKATWAKEDDYFEAEFAVKGQETSATFGTDGRLLVAETEISYADLPATVQAALSARHKGAKVKEAARLVNGSGEVTYETQVSVAGKSEELLFDAEGHELKYGAR